MLVDKVGGSSILFLNCFEAIKLPQDVITAYTSDIYGLDGSKSSSLVVIYFITPLCKGSYYGFSLDGL